MFAPVIGAAYTMTTKREAHWSEQTKAQNTEKGYVGLKMPRGEGSVTWLRPERLRGRLISRQVTSTLLPAVVNRGQVIYQFELKGYQAICSSKGRILPAYTNILI